MTAEARPPAAAGSGPLWFLGTLARVKLGGEATGGRLALVEILLPRAAAPPLHSHPQDETFYVLDGELVVWLVAAEERATAPADGHPPASGATDGRRCSPGDVVFAPAGVPHTFLVESDTARLLVLSTPAGIERYVRELSEPARWPWLQPPAEGPRVAAERLEAVERALGVVRHGPAPQAASS